MREVNMASGHVHPDQLRVELASLFDDCFGKTPAGEARDIWKAMAEVFINHGGHTTAWETLMEAVLRGTE